MAPTAPLKRERQRRGLTQLQLAIRADCSLNTVAIVERGGRLSPTMAARFAGVLGVTVESLVGRPVPDADLVRKAGAQ